MKRPVRPGNSQRAEVQLPIVATGYEQRSTPVPTNGSRTQAAFGWSLSLGSAKPESTTSQFVHTR